jgi:hypothetical protein
VTTLKKTLRGLLAQARQAPGRPICRTLEQAALKLEVLQSPGGNVQLTLERTDTAPTQADWQSVLTAWPEHVPPGVVPMPRKEGRRHALVGRWPRPAELSEASA